MIDFTALQSDKTLILNDRYRIRLLNKNAIPLICDIQEVSENVVLVDLPKAEGMEAKILETQNELQSLILQKSGAAVEEDKENLPDGCVKMGENLQVTFLSIEKLDKLAAANKLRLEENAYEFSSLSRFDDFDLHLVPQMEARMLINRLSSSGALENGPFEFTFIMFTEDNQRESLLFLGKKCTSQIVTFQGLYLGDYYHSINLLDHLSASVRVRNNLSMTEAKCRCRFDLLKDNLIVEKSGNFIPSEFIIEAEWTMDPQIMAKQSTEKMHCIYLMMPPDFADAFLFFKPGWKDARIALNDRINELRHLAVLATHLKESKSPWSGQYEVKDQPEVIDALKQLINNAKVKLDAQTVFPFDFTDRLWDLLKLAKSIATLQHAFQLIYDELQTGEFQVLVEASKVSSVAKMLRMRNPNEIIFSRLEPMICLQFLVEIGLDRFNEELAYRFLENHFLTNGFDLNPFFLPASKPLEQRIERLMPLHLALQSMIMIDQYVCVVQHEKANIAKRLLTHFTSLGTTEAFEKVFVYKTKMEDIRRDKIGESINDWMLERTYAKLVKNGGTNGSFSNAIHISKNFGFKYLQRFPTDNASKNSSKIKQEVISPNAKDDTKVSGSAAIDETKLSSNDEDNNGKKSKQFECVYIMTDRQRKGLFL